MASATSRTLDQLRRALATIEPATAFPVGADERTLPLGLPAADAALVGGLARGALHELAPAAPAQFGAATGFTLAVAALAAARSHGKPVLVIEGVIVGESKKTVDLPRLRFSVRDAQGTGIYAWNTVLEQTRLKPGDRAFFKSRLASPPAEGQSIDVRFFNKRDIAVGNV